MGEKIWQLYISQRINIQNIYGTQNTESHKIKKKEAKPIIH